MGPQTLGGDSRGGAEWLRGGGLGPWAPRLRDDQAAAQEAAETVPQEDPQKLWRLSGAKSAQSLEEAILLLQSRPETGKCNLQCPLVQKVGALTPVVFLQLTPPQEHGTVVHPDSLHPDGCKSMCSALHDLYHSHWDHFAHEPCGQ
ncbi:uncharacterized protein RBU33_004720 [Hipposideros larvatus]